MHETIQWSLLKITFCFLSKFSVTPCLQHEFSYQPYYILRQQYVTAPVVENQQANNGATATANTDNKCSCNFYAERQLVFQRNSTSDWYSCTPLGLYRCGEFCDAMVCISRLLLEVGKKNICMEFKNLAVTGDNYSKKNAKKDTRRRKLKNNWRGDFFTVLKYNIIISSLGSSNQTQCDSVFTLHLVLDVSGISVFSQFVEDLTG